MRARREVTEAVADGPRPTESSRPADHHPPADRVRARMANRYLRMFDAGRRFERPDQEDPRNLAILLRQAAEAFDTALLRCLRSALPPQAEWTILDVEVLRRLRAKECNGSQLAEFASHSPASVSRSADRLQAAGLLIRSTAWHDSRCQSLTLTPLGREVAAEVDAVIDETLNLVGDDVDEVSMTSLLDALSALSDLR